MNIPYIKDLFQNTSITLASFLDQIPVGIQLLGLDRRIVIMNQPLEALLGVSLVDIIGLPCMHILRSKACVKECPILKLKKGAEPISLESDIINRDRQLLPVRITSGPIEGRDGKLVGYLEIVEDMRLLRTFEERVRQSYNFGRIIGRSPQMEKIFNMLPILAESDSSVLITGETGTGKDLVAEAIHQASKRARGPFIKVNCGALPETLLESEIFGHVKGAFTGAVDSKPGRFRMAHNGTLYLTEIGDLPLSLQVKLLTFLDDKIIYPLGGTKGFRANTRIIAGTHHDLEQMVKKGRFRKDLLFRLNVVSIHLPALRDRAGDIRLLLDHFLNTFRVTFGKNIKRFSPKALQILMKYAYPGNVRELRNIVEYAVNVCRDDIILPEHLPSYITETNLENLSDPADRETHFENLLPNRQDIMVDGTWPSTEKNLILEALVKATGRRSKAAEILGWGRSTLWRKMKQYGIDS
ncbi:MAG: sigma 54-interacting transcriptional regulator [Deltaproteobacteria bacterium]|nr:sigma 54-interacting transcriptional regulator [Deltaproteobacteria bacterium]